MVSASSMGVPLTVEEGMKRSSDVMEQIRTTSRTATLACLDVYERTMESLTDARVQFARATNAPLIIGLAEAQAGLAREVTSASVGAARTLLTD